jgi:hypothetical protein
MNMQEQLERAGVDLNTYPIISGSPGHDELMARCRSELEEHGACVLEGFLGIPSVERAIEEIAPHLPDAFYKTKRHNVYLDEGDTQFADHHSRNRLVETSSATLGYFGVEKDTVLDNLYQTAGMRDFVAQTLGYDELFAYSDPMSPVNVLIYAPDTQLGWHFDSSSFTVTLMLRPAEMGGLYQYAPFIRSEGDPGFGAVENILDGNLNGVLELEQAAGDLVIFRGAMTLHRVTQVEGSATRLLSALSYSPQPQYELNPATRRIFYGRES